MKGHIFNLLEEYLIEVAGLEVYEELLAGCSFDSQAGFVRTENYPDAFLEELVVHAVKRLGITTAEAHFSFGRWLLPHLAAMVPNEMLAHSHPCQFLETVDYIHRVELKKLYPDASPPNFSYQALGDQEGILRYQSSRQMYALVEGVLQGVADYFKVPMKVERQEKPHEGVGCCDFHIVYKSLL